MKQFWRETKRNEIITNRNLSETKRNEITSSRPADPPTPASLPASQTTAQPALEELARIAEEFSTTEPAEPRPAEQSGGDPRQPIQGKAV